MYVNIRIYIYILFVYFVFSDFKDNIHTTHTHYNLFWKVGKIDTLYDIEVYKLLMS